MLFRPAALAALAAACSIAACGDAASLRVADGSGPEPALPPPQVSVLPTVNVAKAVRWTEKASPQAVTGRKVTRFATGLDHPRWLHVLPNGDVLVAESNAPRRPKDGQGIRGWFQKQAMKRAGAATPSADRITLLRDADGDGVAELATPFLEGLHSPFGMALIGGALYVANTDAVVMFAYRDGDTRISKPATRVMELPAGDRNHHWTKNILASADGTKLYITVGSNSNVAENGMAEEQGRATIWELDIESGAGRIYASGLRNPNGLAWQPESGELWTTVNERDELGSDLVPDYMTSVREGGFYGWPYSYFGDHVDARVQPPRPDLVASALVPDYALGPHTASLGLVFADGGAYVAQHGSWNRKPRSGYKVVFVPFESGRPAGQPVDVLTGFLNEDGEARGRPVGAAIDKSGALLVADDVGNIVWRVGRNEEAPAAFATGASLR